jgi:hypothetical protein
MPPRPDTQPPCKGQSPAVLVNAQADALGLTNLLSAGVQANKAGKPEISTGHQQLTRMGIDRSAQDSPFKPEGGGFDPHKSPAVLAKADAAKRK